MLIVGKLPFYFLSLVVLTLLGSLIGHLVVCSAPYRLRDRRTDRQTKYCNPRCACTLRVNCASILFLQIELEYVVLGWSVTLVINSMFILSPVKPLSQAHNNI